MSGSGEIKTRLPRTVDRFPLFLNWELDEAAILVTPILLSLPSRKLWIGILVGYGLMRLYMRLKKDKPENYIYHWLWRRGLVKVKGLPPGHVSRFWE